MLTPMIYRFGSFELDTAKVELRSGGEICSVEPQVFALLALLVDNRERLVSKDEIIEKVWDGRVVSEAAVASRIKSARKVLHGPVAVRGRRHPVQRSRAARMARRRNSVSCATHQAQA